MSPSRFVYVTYIRTTPQELWEALTKPEFMRRYWFGCWADSSFETGAAWKLMLEDGTLGDAGEILESKAPNRLVLKWRNEFRPELKEEGYSRATFEIEALDGTTKLTVTHELERPDSKLIAKVSGGWPAILSSLKSLLETGSALERASTLGRRS